MQGMGSKDAFGAGNGLSHQFGLAMGQQGVRPGMFQQAVIDPIRAAAVAFALRGEAITKVSFEDLLTREINIVGIFCQTVGIHCPEPGMIEQALRLPEEANGSVTVNNRFMPGDLTLKMLFQFIYNWNAQRVKDGEAPLKLYDEQSKEWWRENKDVESLPTDAAILTCDFNTVMRATDLAGRPFNLNMDEQIAWAKELGGDGIRSAEEVVYLFIRCLIENQLPLWGGGSVRCKNAFGSDSSLYVFFYADDGFYVDRWSRSGQYWDLGALPGKSLVLAS